MLEQSEIALISQLPDRPFVVDGGGGHGQWCDEVLRQRPEAFVLVFEPHPAHFGVLHQKFDGDSRVTLSSFALSDNSYPIRTLHLDGHPQIGNFGSSLVKRLHYRETITVVTVALSDVLPVQPMYTVKSGDYPYKIAQQFTGDGNRWKELQAANPDKPPFGKEFNIGWKLNLPESWFHIDLLKLDIEGAELEALRGLGDLRPDRIQFEYGGTWQDGGTSVLDAFELLESMGYQIDGKIEADDYQYRNFVAYKKDLIE
jgi:hypothetical protein